MLRLDSWWCRGLRMPSPGGRARRLAVLFVALGWVLSAVLPVPARSDEGAAGGDPVEMAWAAFWAAESLPERADAASRLVAAGETFEGAWDRLERGRPYTRTVPVGQVDLTRKVAGTRHPAVALVPETYDPSHRWPVQVFLHGGVNRDRPSPARGRGGSRREPEPGRITVSPSGWRGSTWWHHSQVENLRSLLAELKRTYNVDENRVFLSGVSDGGTGTYFLAFRDATPWAAFLPFIGHSAALGNPRVGADGLMFPVNLANRAFFVVNGGRDPLYPAASVLPYLDLFARAGAEVVFHPQPEAGHDTSWIPQEEAAIESFVEAHPRDPLPDRLVWETETTERYQRLHWLVIEELGSVAGESSFPELNELFPGPPRPALGLEPERRAGGEGVRVLEVYAGSVARRAGLRRGDVLVEVAGQPVSGLEELSRALAESGGFGTQVPVVVERGGDRLDKVLVFPPEPESRPPVLAFPRTAPSGRVEVERRGNHFEARTQGVRRYRLLLSPREVDLTQEVTVVTNGVESFRGRLEPSLKTLLKWGAEDLDRTMLFAAELEIEVTASP